MQTRPGFTCGIKQGVSPYLVVLRGSIEDLVVIKNHGGVRVDSVGPRS
jgi:hypothetical protein